MLKEILENYIKAQDKYTKAKIELKKIETELTTACRKIITIPANMEEENFRLLATILLEKING